jgi:hypothetical protein
MREEASGNDEHVKESMEWLHKMTLFCKELHEFVTSKVPADANPWDYTSIPGCIANNTQSYGNLLAVCERSMDEDGWHCEYMMDIPCKTSDDCRASVELVQGLGSEICRIINKHPVFGVFMCSESKHRRIGCPVKLFFERPLFMCMALGVEHSWLELQACRSKAAAYLESLKVVENVIE